MTFPDSTENEKEPVERNTFCVRVERKWSSSGANGAYYTVNIYIDIYIYIYIYIEYIYRYIYIYISIYICIYIYIWMHSSHTNDR